MEHLKLQDLDLTQPHRALGLPPGKSLGGGGGSLKPRPEPCCPIPFPHWVWGGGWGAIPPASRVAFPPPPRLPVLRAPEPSWDHPRSLPRAPPFLLRGAASSPGQPPPTPSRTRSLHSSACSLLPAEASLPSARSSPGLPSSALPCDPRLPPSPAAAPPLPAPAGRVLPRALSGLRSTARPRVLPLPPAPRAHIRAAPAGRPPLRPRPYLRPGRAGSAAASRAAER